MCPGWLALLSAAAACGRMVSVVHAVYRMTEMRKSCYIHSNFHACTIEEEERVGGGGCSTPILV